MATEKRDKHSTPTGIQRRFVPSLMEVREAGNDSTAGILHGYTAKFNEPTLLYTWSDGEEWWETIEPGFFDDVLEDDVRCLKNHDSNLVLGRNKAGTCTLAVDEVGLRFECQPDTRISYANDTMLAVERGDISQCSFAFSIKKRSWTEEEMEDGRIKVTFKLEECKRLYDVGPVTYPAYENTEVGVRSGDLEALRAELQAEREARNQTETAPDGMKAKRDRERELILLKAL